MYTRQWIHRTAQFGNERGFIRLMMAAGKKRVA
jgi:hypothetical protein